MTRIEFYSNVDDKPSLLASLVEAALLKRRQVTVLTEDIDSANQLSNNLWQQNATSFLPHAMADHAHAAKTPVVIACKTNAAGQLDAITQDELLINLSAQQPPFFSRFTHLVEMVGNDEADKQNGRIRYKFYRDRGYEIQHIDYAKQNQATLTAVNAE